MATVLPEGFDAGTGLFEEAGELLGLGGGNEGVGSTGTDEDGFALQVGQAIGHEGEHGMQEDGGPQGCRAQEEQAGGDVGSVGEAGGTNLLLVETVEDAGLVDEVGQVAATLFQVVDIKHALSEAAEETRHTVFQHIATRTELASARYKHPPQAAQGVFVSASSM